jgi:hypothetical protein
MKSLCMTDSVRSTLDHILEALLNTEAKIARIMSRRHIKFYFGVGRRAMSCWPSYEFFPNRVVALFDTELTKTWRHLA